MPTGYTAVISEDEFNFKKWILEDLVRGLGVCITLRDDSRSLTSEEIADRLKAKVENSYHKKSLKEAKAKLVLYKKASEKELRDEFESYKQAQDAYDTEKLNEAIALMDRYGKTLKQLKELKSKANTEFLNNLFDFGIEQVTSSIAWDNMINSYTERLQELSKLDYSKWIDAKLEGLQRDIAYHEEGAKEEFDRENERYKYYQELVKFMDKHGGN